MSLRVSQPAAEGVYQGSKWLKYQVLCDGEEMRSLFERLNPFWIYPLTGLVSIEQIPMKQETFLSEYASWIEGLKAGKIPSDAELRRLLACAFTAEPDALWLQEVPGNRYLVKISKPLIQVQAHSFSYSSADGEYRPLSMGTEAIFWGVQFSFPQIYQDAKTMELLEIEASPNRDLFIKIREWVRDATRPTPFIADGKRTNSPIRIGKNCFSWIHAHPQLPQKGIAIHAG